MPELTFLRPELTFLCYASNFRTYALWIYVFNLHPRAFLVRSTPNLREHFLKHLSSHILFSIYYETLKYHRLYINLFFKKKRMRHILTWFCLIKYTHITNLGRFICCTFLKKLKKIKRVGEWLVSKQVYTCEYYFVCTLWIQDLVHVNHMISS